MNHEMGLKKIEKSIISCVCYFDIFDYPLRIEEIHAFLPGIETTIESLRETLSETPVNEIISHRSGYYFLHDREPRIIEQRIRAEKIAGERWPTAKRMAKIIKVFPYVRAVMVSGDLSKNVSSYESDIDYFILTEPNHLWITRTLLILFKKIVLLNDRTYYCLNFFRTTDNLSFQKTKDFFTAIELFTLKTLYNSSWGIKLLDENRWTFSFFPNYRVNGTTYKYISDSQSLLQMFLEKCLDIFPLERIDNYIMNFMKKVWRKRYPELTENEIAYRFRCTRNESTAFVEESKRDIMRAHENKINQVCRQLYNRKLIDTGYD